MKRIILPVGPQGAGKTTYCKKIIHANPHFKLICRDEICIALYGSYYLNPYTGGHEHVKAVMLERLQKMLQNEVTIVLDTFTASPEERTQLALQLREFGAERLEVLRFITPPTVCAEWFCLRERVNKQDQKISFFDDTETVRYTEIFTRYYQKNMDMGEGFDSIQTVCPQQLELFPMVF